MQWHWWWLKEERLFLENLAQTISRKITALPVLLSQGLFNEWHKLVCWNPVLIIEGWGTIEQQSKSMSPSRTRFLDQIKHLFKLSQISQFFLSAHATQHRLHMFHILVQLSFYEAALMTMSSQVKSFLSLPAACAQRVVQCHVCSYMNICIYTSSYKWWQDCRRWGLTWQLASSTCAKCRYPPWKCVHVLSSLEYHSHTRAIFLGHKTHYEPPRSLTFLTKKSFLYESAKIASHELNLGSQSRSLRALSTLVKKCWGRMGKALAPSGKDTSFCFVHVWNGEQGHAVLCECVR